MAKKPTYEELEKRVKELEKGALERKRSEDALKESENRFRTLVEKSVEAIFLVNFDMEIVFWNPAAEEMIGLRTTPTKKITLSDVLTPDSLKIAMANVARASKAGTTQPRPYELTIRKFDGTLADLEVFIGLVEYDGKPHMLGTARDITERNKAEEALKTSHRFLEIASKHGQITPMLKELISVAKNFTACAAVGIRMLDEEGNIPYEAYVGFSQRFYESESPLSIKSDQCMCINVIRGMTDPKLPFYTGGGSFYMNGTTRFLATVSEEEKGKTRNVCNDMGYESVALIPICVGDRILGLIHVADPQENMVPLEKVELLEDIGVQLGTAIQRLLAEEALRESEEKYRSLVESTEDSIYLLDKNCKYLFMNKKHLTRLSLAPKKAIGRTYAEFHSEDEIKEFVGKVEKVFETGKSLLYEHRSQRDSRYFLRTLSPVKEPDGNIKAVTVVSKDITERKQTEEALRRSNEELLKENNQGRILSKRLIELLEKDLHQIAMELHDHIGQTLVSLKMNLEMIHRKLKPGHTELGAQIKAAQERAIQAIKDVKNVAHGLRPTMIEALGVVSCLRELFNEIQQQTDIEVHFFSRKIPKRFEEEKELAIYRIAQEALNNIIKHAQAQKVFVNLIKKKEILSLSVEDDGVGFDQDKVMKLSKRKGPLGLLIMRERAEQFDGELTIESQLGKGTHLLVEIPL